MIPKQTRRRNFLRGLLSGGSLAAVPHVLPSASIPIPHELPVPKFKLGDTVYSEFMLDVPGPGIKTAWWKGVICGLVWSPEDAEEWGYVCRWNGVYYDGYQLESHLEEDMARFKREGKL